LSYLEEHLQLVNRKLINIEINIFSQLKNDFIIKMFN